ncbi:hypothetical protein V1511DRAFT_295270 [Dipodascopsis uninucleata]
MAGKEKVDTEKLWRSLSNQMRNFKFSRLPRFVRLIAVLCAFALFILMMTALSDTKGFTSPDGLILPGDLDPPFLTTAERRCPASQINSRRTVLLSASNPFLTAMRINFNGLGRSVGASKDSAVNRYNPSILPLPAGSKYPYIGFASQSKGYTSELYVCYLSRGQKKISKRLGLQCATDPELVAIETPESGNCPDHLYLGLRKGPQTPRVFFAPDGAPILTYSANSESDCIGVWMVDVRSVYPPLMEIFPNPPLQYVRPTELNRPGSKLEMEQNWVFMFMNNKTFIQQDLYPRTYSSIGWQTKNLAPKSFSCVNALTQNKESAVLRQATNTLRLSLCHFPCTPTEENTVLISIVHVKYQEGYRPYYEKRVLLTSATFPFDIIGYSPSLLIAGTDEQELLYTTSLTWDSTQSPRKERANVYNLDRSTYAVKSDATDSGSSHEEEAGRQNSQEKPSNEKAPAKVKVDKRADTPEEKKLKKILKVQEEHADKSIFRDYTVENLQLKGFESDYYHGYLDDVILIGFGIEDRESAVIDVRAEELVKCLIKCNN